MYEVEAATLIVPAAIGAAVTVIVNELVAVAACTPAVNANARTTIVPTAGVGTVKAVEPLFAATSNEAVPEPVTLVAEDEAVPPVTATAKLVVPVVREKPMKLLVPAVVDTVAVAEPLPVIVKPVACVMFPSVALAETAVKPPSVKAATATSAMRLKVVFVDICFLSISRSREFPPVGFG
jgi:hypothetical protein